jgi:hypothetical protein
MMNSTSMATITLKRVVILEVQVYKCGDGYDVRFFCATLLKANAVGFRPYQVLGPKTSKSLTLGQNRTITSRIHVGSNQFDAF